MSNFDPAEDIDARNKRLIGSSEQTPNHVRQIGQDVTGTLWMQGHLRH